MVVEGGRVRYVPDVNGLLFRVCGLGGDSIVPPQAGLTAYDPLISPLKDELASITFVFDQHWLRERSVDCLQDSHRQQLHVETYIKHNSRI